jgi:branched-subunit amino acid aminotransferase/4-amino-4-deoxychorismate lyase
MTASFLLTDGEWQTGAAIPASDRGFRFGMSVFETIAIRASRPLLPGAHVERLARAVARAGFTPPAAWRGAVAAFLERPAINEGVVRIYVTAGDGAPAAPSGASRVAALAEEMPIPADASIAACTAALVQVPDPGALPSAKTGNYWQNILALAEAARLGCDEAIRVSAAGKIIGASMANLFLVRDGRLETPDLASGARDGAVRAWVIGRFDVRCGPVDAAALDSASECFLTNSRIGIRAIASIGSRRLGPPALAGAIWRAYRESVVLHASRDPAL